jgi:hypothetical protein
MTVPSSRQPADAQRAEDRRRQDLARRMELLVAKMHRDQAYDGAGGYVRAPHPPTGRADLA